MCSLLWNDLSPDFPWQTSHICKITRVQARDCNSSLGSRPSTLESILGSITLSSPFVLRQLASSGRRRRRTLLGNCNGHGLSLILCPLLQRVFVRLLEVSSQANLICEDFVLATKSVTRATRLYYVRPLFDGREEGKPVDHILGPMELQEVVMQCVGLRICLGLIARIQALAMALAWPTCGMAVRYVARKCRARGELLVLVAAIRAAFCGPFMDIRNMVAQGLLRIGHEVALLASVGGCFSLLAMNDRLSLAAFVIAVDQMRVIQIPPRVLFAATWTSIQEGCGFVPCVAMTAVQTRGRFKCLARDKFWIHPGKVLVLDDVDRRMSIDVRHGGVL